jgi:hypothetical protein
MKLDPQALAASQIALYVMRQATLRPSVFVAAPEEPHCQGSLRGAPALQASAAMGSPGPATGGSTLMGLWSFIGGLTH